MRENAAGRRGPFLLASLLQQLTAVRQIGFSEASEAFPRNGQPARILDGLSAAFAELSSFPVTLSGQPSLDIEQQTNRQIEAWKNFSSVPAPIPRQTLVPVPPNFSGKWECEFRCCSKWLENAGLATAFG